MKIINAYRRPSGLLAISAALASCAAHAQTNDEAFLGLADAYRSRDAGAAAANYSEDAIVIYAYDGVPEERIEGREAIEASFRSFFEWIDSTLPLDLNFRIAERDGANAFGYYRLRFGNADTAYGRFDVVQQSDGLFANDRSSDATRSAFEELAGPLLVRPDENELDRSYYGLLAGRYRLPDGCDLVVTRSIVRLFVRNTCDQTWRGLERVSGLEWVGGERVLSDDKNSTYRFAKGESLPGESLQIAVDGIERVALRATPYSQEDISFRSADGTLLAGTLYKPDNRQGPAPAIVLVHGSGPQDRDGYASIIAVLADALAADGRVVLAYDKRGSGASQGNGDGAGFDVLAADAIAAMTYLRTRKEVLPDAVGLAGSSQAGWVIAKAIERDAAPADVFLLGAAGTAFSVREQNIYNTDVRMACAGLEKAKRVVALEQQAAFFDAVADRSRAPRLDALTRAASGEPELRDWLFPASDGLDMPNAWFTVLDPFFDPLPIWRTYEGRLYLVFSEFDDSTDTSTAIKRLRNIKATVEVVSNAQHLGLDAATLCDGELGERTRFSKQLFVAIRRFADPSGRSTN